MSTIAENRNRIDKLNKDEIKERVKKLKELVKEDLVLKKYRQDDEWLFQFLITNNFNVSDAFNKMIEYVEFLGEYENWVAIKPPLDIVPLLEKKYLAFLESRDNQKRGIMVVKFCNIYTDCPVQEYSQSLEMVVDHAHFLYPEIRENGFSAILDMKKLPYKLIQWCTPTNVKAAVKLIEQYPCPSVLVHVVNTALPLDIAIKIVWPFLPDKIKDMIKFHFTDWPSLHQYISPDALPMEYGGTLPNIDFEESNQRLYTDNDIFAERLKLRKAVKT